VLQDGSTATRQANLVKTVLPVSEATGRCRPVPAAVLPCRLFGRLPAPGLTLSGYCRAGSRVPPSKMALPASTFLGGVAEQFWCEHMAHNLGTLGGSPRGRPPVGPSRSALHRVTLARAW
jgi:hypothetical protein